MNQIQRQLANLEQRLYEREHHARLGMGRLDRSYLDLQERRRELSAAWMEEMTAKIRKLERENAALRRRAGEAAGVVLTERGFEQNET